MNKALMDNAWVNHINTQHGMTFAHIQKFATLWEKLDNANIQPGVRDSIIRKLTNYRIYTASSASKAQFAGHLRSLLQDMVWKVWSPPKCNFFTWLVTQNRIWTADRFQRRGWPNCDQCPLCSQVQKWAVHLLFK